MNPEIFLNQGEPAELSKNELKHTLLRCLDADSPKWSRHPSATWGDILQKFRTERKWALSYNLGGMRDLQKQIPRFARNNGRETSARNLTIGVFAVTETSSGTRGRRNDVRDSGIVHLFVEGGQVV